MNETESGILAEKAAADGQELRRLLNFLRRGWPAIAFVAAIFGVVGFVYSAVQTPIYQASATLYVTSGTDDNSSTAYQGSLASQQRVVSYTRLANSDAVVRQAISDERLGIDVDAAKSDIDATSSSDTVLLTISALNSNKDQAERLANAVSSAMISYVARLETPSGGGQPLAKLTLVSPAAVSNTPVSPKTTQNVGLGLALGLLVGAVGVMVRFRLSNRIREDSDFGAVAGSPVLASVPADSFLQKRGLIDFRDGATVAAEAFRKLRTNLGFSNVDNPPRIIVISSAVAIEGKTTTAMNLAAALVEAGGRVVLVDADLRRPQIDVRAGLIGDVGLTNLLRGDGELNELVQPTQLDGLWVLASGPRPPNPAELLGAQRAGQALRELAASFDYVIVDTPPLLPVTDGVVLSQWADGVVLVARSGSTRIGELRDAYGQVSATRTPVLGFVLTEARTNKARYGYYANSAKQKKSFFRRGSEPKAIENVLEPKPTSKH